MTRPYCDVGPGTQQMHRRHSSITGKQGLGLSSPRQGGERRIDHGLEGECKADGRLAESYRLQVRRQHRVCKCQHCLETNTRQLVSQCLLNSSAHVYEGLGAEVESQPCSFSAVACCGIHASKLPYCCDAGRQQQCGDGHVPQKRPDAGALGAGQYWLRPLCRHELKVNWIAWSKDTTWFRRSNGVVSRP